MPLPRWLARFNRRVTNPLLGPVVAFVPGFGYLVHIGRRSGRAHRTPVLTFTAGDRVVIALTYGPATEWVRNILAAGQCEFTTRRMTLRLVEPRRFSDPARRSVGPPMRWVLRLLGASDFLELRVVRTARRPAPGRCRCRRPG